jgi:hypothetical protein
MAHARPRGRLTNSLLEENGAFPGQSDVADCWP